jgi:hypothetical protein
VIATIFAPSPRLGLVLAFSAALTAVGSSQAFATTWVNPSTDGFSTLALNTPTPFAFPGTGGMVMTRTSAVGSGVTLGTDTITYAATISSYTNPDWVVGTRTYYKVSFVSGATPYAGSTVS